MTPVEGCPMVFQTICSLPPGCHQYKFVVDGEWRHDEHQPSVNSNIGTVNTILLSTEADYLTPMLHRQAPPSGHGSSMDVDSESFQRVVRLSDSTPPEPFPTVTQADIDVSRHRIAVFLSAHKAYELLPESGKAWMICPNIVIALDVELPVKQAFHILHEQMVSWLSPLFVLGAFLTSFLLVKLQTLKNEKYSFQGISMAPLWDFSKGKFVGVLSAMDFILIMRELFSSSLTPSWQAWVKFDGGRARDAYYICLERSKVLSNNQINGQGAIVPRQLVQAGPDDSLNEVALKILQSGVATVPIIHSPSADSPNKNLLHLASLSGILKCQYCGPVTDTFSICRFFRHSPGSLPVLQLPICSIPLGTWVPKTGEPNRRPLAMLRPSASLGAALNFLIQDPLHKVLERLSQPVRRLVVVEAGSKHVEGIVSLGDAFRFLMGR
ncbi:hypothetical protein SASPL_158143 [Salvia splendens]|uniref:CBS domain-containing protein n=1 Tax=Salvia splendens TaxID=180675 RepID=A0A8X8VTS2_SALSN|nr:hypothetical protein SASPL_158143 [Salvia splendens]